MMKVTKYKLSGTTHKNGITATSEVTWLVVASSARDAHAGNPTQRNRSRTEAGSPRGAEPCATARKAGNAFTAHTAQARAKPANNQDQARACVSKSKAGSNT